MNIFVTGGTGVLGRPVVERLVGAGHRVRGLARSEKAAETLRRLGAEPVRTDLFDPGSLREAVQGAEVVLHLATRIPPVDQARRPEAWQENDRIRQEGTRNLVDAALASGVKTLIYPSVGLVYAHGGDSWLDATTAAVRPPSEGLPPSSTLDAEAEVARFAACGGRGIVLRMGQFYGAEPLSLELLRYARQGIAAVPGPSEAYWSSIWVDDAAEAVVAALDERVPTGIYDVVDDEPVQRQELVAVLARAAGRKRIWQLPSPIYRLLAGPMAKVSRPSLRISNRRFKEVSGWAPRVPSVREGWPRIAATATGPAGSAHRDGDGRVPAERRARAGLGALLVLSLPVGLWALLAPRSFYDDFPGFGRLWVSVDGPFNEHLIRDVGGLTLGLAAVALFAFVRPTASMVRAVATGSLVFGLPHFVYHLAHLDLLPTTLDQVSQTSALAAAPLVALALLREAGRLDATTSRPHSEQEPAPAGLASQPEPASPTPVLR